MLSPLMLAAVYGIGITRFVFNVLQASFSMLNKSVSPALICADPLILNLEIVTHVSKDMTLKKEPVSFLTSITLDLVTLDV